MCVLPMLAAAGSLFGGTAAATAAGATAAAATGIGSTIATIGTGLSVAGSLYSGIASYKAGKQQEALLEQQAATERQLNAVEDDRARREYMSQISQQRAELAGRGVSLDSPTAVLLGRSAAQEMSFASQSIRSGGQATQIELSQAGRLARSRATQGLLSGTVSAAGSLLKGAPEIWPELRG